MPAISIIVPVYNVEKYLNRCVDSILAQTFTDFELILVDDGSTDKSGKICDEYAEKDSRIKVIHQKNQGQAAARNNALDIAQGEYITFVDSDDWVVPRYLEILINNIKKTNAEISVCHFKKVFENENLPEMKSNTRGVLWSGREFLMREMRDIKEDKNWGVACCKLFIKSCFDSLRFPEGRIYEDNSVVYRLLYEANAVVYCDDELYYYRQRKGSTVNSGFTKKKCRDRLLMMKEMLEYFSEKDEDELKACAERIYTYILFESYRDARKSLPYTETEFLKELKQDLKNQVKKERKKYKINIKTHPYIYEALYPRLSFFYWLLIGIKGRFKHGDT